MCEARVGSSRELVVAEDPVVSRSERNSLDCRGKQVIPG